MAAGGLAATRLGCLQFGIAQVGHEHVAGFVCNQERGLRGHRHGLRGYAARPEDGDFAWVHRHGIAVIGPGEILYADRVRVTEVHRRAVGMGKSAADACGGNGVSGSHGSH